MLSELYERRVITSKDIHCMKEMKGDLMLRLIMIQSDKESNVVTETLVTMRRHSSSGSDETIVYPSESDSLFYLFLCICTVCAFVCLCMCGEWVFVP